MIKLANLVNMEIHKTLQSQFAQIVLMVATSAADPHKRIVMLANQVNISHKVNA